MSSGSSSFSALPKVRVARSFNDLRWLGLIPTLQRFYYSVLRRWYNRKQAASNCLCYSYGFRLNIQVGDIVGALAESIWLASEWQGFGLVVFGGDVLTAFDRCKHGELTLAQASRGMPWGMTSALHQEKVGVRCAALIVLTGVR